MYRLLLEPTACRLPVGFGKRPDIATPNDTSEVSLRVGLWTALALTAFAGNSILCRMALGTGAIDALSFTSLRLLSGGLALLAIVSWGSWRSGVRLSLDLRRWQPGAYLIGYALSFSLAYVLIETGIGALLLFSTVQLSMFAIALKRGNRPSVQEWVGVGVAFAGLVWLLSPGLQAPPLVGALLMALSGFFWGLYTLAGQGESDPATSTARNFLLCAPFAVLLILPGLAGIGPALQLTRPGILLAITSGAVTSGLGYIVWYGALKHLTTTHAAIVQLAVPVIAAFGGVVFIGEALTLRFGLAGLVILGGIFLSIRARR